VDTAGNVYASGFVAQPTGGGAIALIKYADNGDLQFVKVFPNDDIGRAAQAFTLSLPPATNRPTFYGQPPNENKEFVAFDFDNPAVVLAPPTSTHPPLFNGEVSLSNGVYFLAFATTGNPFGYYSYLSDPRFIYHFDLGYEYWFDAGDGKNGIYFYDFKSGSFFYTSPNFPFPYLYDFSLNATLYYYPDPNNPGHYNTNGVRYFYNYATGQIITK